MFRFTRMSSAKLFLSAACLSLVAGCADKTPDTELDWGVYNHGWPDAGPVSQPGAQENGYGPETAQSQNANDGFDDSSVDQQPPVYHGPARDTVQVSSLGTVSHSGMPTKEDLANAPIHPAKPYVAPADKTAPTGPTSGPTSGPRSLTKPHAAPVQRVAKVAGAPAFIWPLHGKVLDRFGETHTGGQNDGINIAVRKGTPIHAAASGTVEYAGNGIAGYGYLVLIRHKGNYFTAYAHADRLKVHKGDPVVVGQVIGLAGTSGDVAAPQLHFEIRHGKTPVNPSRYLGKGAAG